MTTPNLRSVEDAVEALANFYQTLAPASLDRLGEFYAPDAHFKDPFNEVVGVAAIRRIFEHMFATADAPRFVVTRRIVQGDQAMLGWDFHLRLRGREIVVRGVSHLSFDADGRVGLHRDYWDPAEELYVHLPVIGVLMRALRRKLSATG
jgi:ketosteroid isomerase-like protein